VGRHAGHPTRDPDGARPSTMTAEGEVEKKPRLNDERRRVLVIVLFVAGSLIAALVLAFLYSLPSAAF
jgi:uncharacterized membrane protein YbjE (DUF340 family)